LIARPSNFSSQPYPGIEGGRSLIADVGLGADRQHRHGMQHLLKAVQRFAADTPGRRIVLLKQCGILCFELLQLAEQFVVFRVGYGWLVQLIVGTIVLFNLMTQLCRAVAVFGRDHHQENNLRA
jgi:hypothetical protein